MIVRALNSEGFPVANAAVQFTTTSNSTFTNVSTTTDQQGYAQATVNVPSIAANGIQNFTATVGGQQVVFTVNVGPTTGGGGTGGGTGTPVGGLQILKGQGQIFAGLPDDNSDDGNQLKTQAASLLKNVPIAWTISQGFGNLLSLTEITDENGIAYANFANPLVPPGNPFSQAQISASTGAETANFYVTTLANQQNGSRGQATYILKRPVDRTISARSGETNGSIIEVQVVSLLGPPIENVGVRINTDAVGAPTAIAKAVSSL